MLPNLLCPSERPWIATISNNLRNWPGPFNITGNILQYGHFSISDFQMKEHAFVRNLGTISLSFQNEN